jgi:transglutaminase-like putative cysteine protease
MASHSGNAPGRARNRREFLKAGLAATVAIPYIATPFAQDLWRTFELQVTVDLHTDAAASQVWLPLPLAATTAYQRMDAQTWTGNSHTARVVIAPRSRLSMLHATWEQGVTAPRLTLTTRVSTRGHRVALNGEEAPRGRDADVAHYLEPTALIPTDGVVRDTALAITRGKTTPLSRARAVYDWIVDNTFRDPAVAGCGVGDIRWMLTSGSLGGKCADLNALFVGLCRAAGLPARDLYGVRVADSATFKSLGRSGDITSAQHCRAEVFVEGIGWIPADPADVRKVALEERPGAAVGDPPVQRARQALFGSWEMNWIAYNDAHDVVLPGSRRQPLPFLMYPQAEVGGVARDPLTPREFRYQIHVREIG